MSTVTEAPAASGNAIFVLPEIVYPVADLAIDEMRAKFMPLEIANIDDKKGFEAVHEARMACVQNRVAIEKTRKELKAGVIEAGKAIDGEAKRLTALLEPVETHLDGEEARYKSWIEDRKRAAKEAEQAKVNARLEQLAAVGAMMNPTVVAILSDDEWTETLAARTQEAAEKRAAEEAAAAERKAEAERIALERAELEKIKAKQEAELAEARRKEEGRQAAERAEIEAEKRKQAEEQAKLDAERKRIADEEAERKRLADIEQAKADAAERAKREAEERQRREAADAKAKADAEQAAREKAERLRPDRDKLLSVADSVEALEMPAMATAEGVYAAALIRELLLSTASKVRDAAGMIGEMKSAQS